MSELSSEELRFQSELEFVQCLSNPSYLQYLFQGQLFEEASFVRYLAYLQYWREPQYAQFIVYPQCLHFLELVQRESFRKELGNTQFVDMLLKQQFNHWRFFQAMRANQAIEEAKDAIVAKNAAAAAAADATEAAE